MPAKITYNRPDPGSGGRRPPYTPSPLSLSSLLNHPKSLISLVVILVSMAILFMAVFGDHGYFALRRQQELLKQSQQERSKAQAEQERLKKELQELRSPEGVERVAREEIKLAKPGEIVVTLPDSNNANASGSNASGKPGDSSSRSSKDR